MWHACNVWVCTRAVIISVSVLVSGSYGIFLRNIGYRLSDICKVPDIWYCTIEFALAGLVKCWIGQILPYHHVVHINDVIVDKLILQWSIDVNVGMYYTNNCDKSIHISTCSITRHGTSECHISMIVKLFRVSNFFPKSCSDMVKIEEFSTSHSFGGVSPHPTSISTWLYTLFIFYDIHKLVHKKYIPLGQHWQHFFCTLNNICTYVPNNRSGMLSLPLAAAL